MRGEASRRLDKAERHLNPARWYMALLDCVIEWPSPWWLLAVVVLVFGPCVAFAVGLGLLLGSGSCS